MIGFVACDKTPEWKKNSFTNREVTRAADDVELPPLLWKRIEAVFTGAHVSGDELASKGAASGARAGSHHEAQGNSAGAHGAEAASEVGEATGHQEESGHGASGGGEAASGGEHGGGGHGGGGGIESHISLPTEFAPLKVYLIEKNRGILQRQNVSIEFGPGGGELDLRDLVQNKSGSFRLAVEFLADAPPEAVRKVFYLSNSVRRKRGSEVIGNGCNRYYDITSVFTKAMKSKGLLLNTTDQRHVSALAGTYFFAVKHEGKLNLAQLTIRDSGQRALHCRR